MNRELFEPIVTIAAGIIGIAMVAVLVSQKANTSGVLAAAGGAFSNAVSAAVSPVTGNSAAPNVNGGPGSDLQRKPVPLESPTLATPSSPPPVSRPGGHWGSPEVPELAEIALGALCAARLRRRQTSNTARTANGP